MFKTIKFLVFFAIYIILSTRFLFMIWDPVKGGMDLSQGVSIYRDFRNAFDWLYYIGDYLMLPIYFIYNIFAPVIPKLPFFPGAQSVDIYNLLDQTVGRMPVLAVITNAPGIKQALVGYIDELTPIAMIFYRLLDPLLDWVTDFVKNTYWNMVIENSFTKRKESTYTDALGKRAVDLMTLNKEFKSLSKEATILAVSVITDELTNVYNKRFFLDKIQEMFKDAKAKKKRLSVAMVDIDHFKKLNDNYGHLMGDKVLRSVAYIAKSNTPKDCFCCRFGGEEFAIIMPDKSLAESLAIISQIHQSIPLLRFEEDPELRTAASFGICVSDFKNPSGQALETFEDLIKLADDELYRAKLNGRNRIECNELTS